MSVDHSCPVRLGKDRWCWLIETQLGWCTVSLQDFPSECKLLMFALLRRALVKKPLTCMWELHTFRYC